VSTQSYADEQLGRAQTLHTSAKVSINTRQWR